MSDILCFEHQSKLSPLNTTLRRLSADKNGLQFLSALENMLQRKAWKYRFTFIYLFSHFIVNENIMKNSKHAEWY